MSVSVGNYYLFSRPRLSQDDRLASWCIEELGLLTQPSSQHLSSALPLFPCSVSICALGLSLPSSSTVADNSETRVLMVDAVADGDDEETESP